MPHGGRRQRIGAPALSIRRLRGHAHSPRVEPARHGLIERGRTRGTARASAAVGKVESLSAPHGHWTTGPKRRIETHRPRAACRRAHVGAVRAASGPARLGHRAALVDLDVELDEPAPRARRDFERRARLRQGRLEPRIHVESGWRRPLHRIRSRSRERRVGERRSRGSARRRRGCGSHARQPHARGRPHRQPLASSGIGEHVDGKDHGWSRMPRGSPAPHERGGARAHGEGPSDPRRKPDHC